jgi:Zn-finger nucleic acid-binding protein
MAERSGVEVDYCSKCRGVWLDRGELDKIIERAEALHPTRAAPASPGEQYAPRYERDHRDGHDDDDRRDLSERDPRRRRRGGFLGDLLDFGGD